MGDSIGVQIILCDAAQADSQTGKMHMLGAGWSCTGSPTGSMAVALLMKLPRDRARTEQQFPFTLSLIDVNDHVVEISSGQEDRQVVTRAVVGPGGAVSAEGPDLDASFALNVPPLPLSPGRYRWRVEIDGQTCSAPFVVDEGR